VELGSADTVFFLKGQTMVILLNVENGKVLITAVFVLCLGLHVKTLYYGVRWVIY